MRRLALLPLLIVLLLSLSTASAAIEGVTVSGGDLPHAIRLAPADADAFQRRINTPPELDNAPRTSGPSYTITSTYWDKVLRGERDDREPAEADAVYYPQGGYVKARQGGKDVW